MSSRSKEAKRPLYDFGSNLDPERIRTGTISDLLFEINKEDTEIHVVVVNEKSLEPTFLFIERVTGRPLDRSIKRRLPLSTLKTIKFLYRESTEGRKNSKKHYEPEEGMQLLQLLEPPHISGKPTLEFSTTGNSPRAKHHAEAIQGLMGKFRTELSIGQLDVIDSTLLTPAKQLESIEREKRNVLVSIYIQSEGDPTYLAASFRRLTREISNYTSYKNSLKNIALYAVGIDPEASTQISDKKIPQLPLDEEIYTYLRCLGFLHYCGEYGEVIKISKIKGRVNPILESLNAFCEILSESAAYTIHRDLPVTSIKGFPAFVHEHAKALRGMVYAATGVNVRPDTLGDLVHLAGKILTMYLIHTDKALTVDSIFISVSDCVAVLCTVAHQQKVKTKCKVYWLGQGEVSDSPRKYLDKGRGIEGIRQEDYIPHGVSQLLYNRYCEFHMAIIDQSDRYHAYMEYQLAVLKVYAEYFQSNDIAAIKEFVADFYKYSRYVGAIASGFLDEDNEMEEALERELLLRNS